MLSKEFANIFIKICLGITMILCAASVLILSLKYNTAKAGSHNPDFKSPAEDKYIPVGIEIKDNSINLYGYNENKTLPSEKIIVLAQKHLSR